MNSFLRPKIQTGNPLTEKKTKQEIEKNKNTLALRNVPKNGIKTIVNPDAKHLSALPDNLLRCTDTIILKRYDLKLLGDKNEGKRIGLIGASGSGKTKLMIEMMKANMDIPAWMIVNPSESANRAYSRFVPSPGVIHDSPDVDKILEKVYKFKKRQYVVCDKWGIPDSDPLEFYHDPRAGLVIDDCNEKGKTLYKDGVWGWVYSNSRNYHAHFWHLVQYIYQLIKEHRKQLSHIFCFRVSSEDDFKTLYKEFGGAFATCGGLKTFIKVFAKATEDCRCLVLDIGTRAVKLEDRVFWYRAQLKHEPFTIGADWWKTLCQQQYDPDWKEKHPEVANEGLEYVPKGKKAKEKVEKPKKINPEDIDIILQE